MTRYVALIDGEAGGYGVWFPDCPGCTAMAETVDAALEQATAALREWMADRVSAGSSPPMARSVEAIRTDPDAGDDIAAGAIVATVPLLLDAGRSVRANLSIDAGLLASIDEAARLRGVTRSTFLASAAREKIAAGR